MANNKKSKVDLIEIDAARINDVCDNYFKWKSLNDSLKSFCSRGINIPDSKSEPIGYFCLDYFWNKKILADVVYLDHIESQWVVKLLELLLSGYGGV